MRFSGAPKIRQDASKNLRARHLACFSAPGIFGRVYGRRIFRKKNLKNFAILFEKILFEKKLPGEIFLFSRENL